MKKRLRKKFHVGEFREYCFCASFRFEGEAKIEDVEQFIDNLLDQCVEPNHLCCDAFIAPNEMGRLYITGQDAKVADERNRELVKSWMEQQEGIELVSVSEYFDAWYGNIDN